MNSRSGILEVALDCSSINAESDEEDGEVMSERKINLATVPEREIHEGQLSIHRF